MNNFRNLLVWKKSMILVKDIYQITEKFPSTEKFGLVTQMRRAAISVSSNIAEGCEREGKKDFANFLIVAKSSAAELETQILICLMLKYISEKKSEELVKKVIEIKKMLTALRKKILTTNH